ncbi:MAG: HD family phosphohydrolase [Phycisphaerales bacterium]
MAKTATGKATAKTPVITRRGGVRRALPREPRTWRALLVRRETYTCLLIAIIFVITASSVTMWARRRPLIGEGQIAGASYAARVEVEMLDRKRTEEARNMARMQAPRVYKVNSAFLKELRAALTGLPVAVAGKTSVAEVSPELVRDFNLTNETLVELSRFVDAEGEATPEWREMIDGFFKTQVYRTPLIDGERWQVELTLMRAPIRLQLENGETLTTTVDSLVDVRGEAIGDTIDRLVRPFPEALRPAVRARLSRSQQATFLFDAEATRVEKDEAAARVPDEFETYRAGELIYRRGDILTADQVGLLAAEHEQYLDAATPAMIWAERVAVIGFIALITFLMGGYIAVFYRRLIVKPARLLTIASLMVAMLVLTVMTTSAAPVGLVFLVTAPAVLCGVVLVVAYDQRFAIGIGGAYIALVCFALEARLALAVLALLGVGVAVSRLREIRDRNRLVHAGALTGLALAIGALIYAAIDRPITDPLAWLKSAMTDSVGGAAAGLGVGIFTLGILSTVERLFNVTTGLTLVELRDPKQPLLRELQQRAPGTWNHSLLVANLAEAAAEEIGADSLLTYAGALYHDIGKMNKPGYFVENQSGGENRHKKLSPAMSLLIIVGHVKDGIEMAREYTLPKAIHHFIEAHHGTTLVEYFYYAAKEKSEAGETHDQPEEVEYRYPGPRPQSKEVAILMLADAVESASRAMTDPTPARIEQLVRGLSQKRLLDDQFDDCDLTLRELRIIEDSLIKSLNAIYHSRVAYPKGEREEDDREREPRADSTRLATG